MQNTVSSVMIDLSINFYAYVNDRINSKDDFNKSKN